MKIEKHLIAEFGTIRCCLLTAKVVYEFVEQKLQSGLSPRYVSDILVLLKSVFRYANREYRIKNVLDGIFMSKCQKPEIRLLTTSQQESLRRYIGTNPKPTTLGVSIAMQMGLRIGELCALQWQDIDFEKRTLTVRKTIQRVQCQDERRRTRLLITEPKSARSMREIPIPDCLLKMLLAFKGNPECFVLSGTAKPVEPRTIQYRFAKMLKRLGLPSVHFHSLRHAFATGCIVLGFDMKTLSEILGHSSVEITLSRYVHSSMERKRACMNLISA